MSSTESGAVLTSMVISLGTVLMMTVPNWSLIKSEASWGKEDEQRGELGFYTDKGDGLQGLQPGDQLLGLHLLDLLLKDPPAPVHGAGVRQDGCHHGEVDNHPLQVIAGHQEDDPVRVGRVHVRNITIISQNSVIVRDATLLRKMSSYVSPFSTLFTKEEGVDTSTSLYRVEDYAPVLYSSVKEQEKDKKEKLNFMDHKVTVVQWYKFSMESNLVMSIFPDLINCLDQGNWEQFKTCNKAASSMDHTSKKEQQQKDYVIVPQVILVEQSNIVKEVNVGKPEKKIIQNIEETNCNDLNVPAVAMVNGRLQPPQIGQVDQQAGEAAQCQQPGPHKPQYLRFQPHQVYV